VKAFRGATSTQFKDDYTYWQNRDKKKRDRIDILVTNTLTNPFGGDLAGCWSRRIDREHQLVYRVKDGVITFLQCQHHYD
jgi:toxin YoeB